MEHLWRGGPPAGGDALEPPNRSGERKLAYTTVMTILVRLHEKGHVTRQKEGRRFRYAAALDEASLRARVGRAGPGDLTERYGAGSVPAFATELGEGDLADRLARVAREPR